MGLISRVSSRTYRRTHANTTSAEDTGVRYRLRDRMVKHVDDRCIFESSWADTVEGAVHKYPNDHSQNIASVDTLERSIDCDGNLVTKKMLRTHFNPNPILKKVMKVLGMPPQTHQTSLEINQIDLSRKLLRLQSLNKSYFNHIRCFEVLEYRENVSNPSTTELQQFALIDMYANECSFALRWAVQAGESQFASQYIKNSKNNRQGLVDKTVLVSNELVDKTVEVGKEVIGETQEIVEESTKLVKKTVEKVLLDDEKKAAKDNNA